MEATKTRLSVYDLKGKVVDSIELDGTLFDGTVNKTLLYEVVKMYQANVRRGTHSSLTRAEVAGGGVKPWRQKGTGRARVGSTRNPVWRHGGITFGPKPRDYEYTMPKKAMRKALLSSLNARLSEEMIMPVVKVQLKEAKTKEMKQVLNNLKLTGKTLLVVDVVDENVRRAAHNLQDLTMKEGRNINARDVLVNEHILIEKEALEKLAERVK
ncbi:MAG: 50S ribosomal protein L4 [Candidatus Omnitrophica bacterium]|nr:50S ribosomal protein L4 [Candidatus Omnitrophota bacterium]